MPAIFGEEAVQLQLEKKLMVLLLQRELEKKLVELEKKLMEHREITRASPFCYVIDIFCWQLLLLCL